MQVDGFNAPKPSTPHFSRSLGVSQAMFGARLKSRGVHFEDDRPEVTRPPNRVERRMMAARAHAQPERPCRKGQKLTKTKTKAYKALCGEKRNLRIAIRTHKPSYLLLHKPHVSYALQYLDPEQLLAYKQDWTDEDRAKFQRGVKNALRRRRQGRK